MCCIRRRAAISSGRSPSVAGSRMGRWWPQTTWPAEMESPAGQQSGQERGEQSNSPAPRHRPCQILLAEVPGVQFPERDGVEAAFPIILPAREPLRIAAGIAPPIQIEGSAPALPNCDSRTLGAPHDATAISAAHASLPLHPLCAIGCFFGCNLRYVAVICAAITIRRSYLDCRCWSRREASGGDQSGDTGE